MKLAAYLTLTSVFAMSLADMAEAPVAVQYGALSIMAWTVWYLMAKAFPAHVRAQKEDRAAFLSAQREEREAYLKSQQAARRDFRRSLRGLARSIDRIAEAEGKRPPR